MFQSIPLPVFLVMLAFPLAMTGICVYAGIYARQRAALVQRVKTSTIRMARPGYVELEGRVEAINRRTVTAPLTLSPCCWYRARVERRVRRRNDSDGTMQWEAVLDETSETPFFVRDASGACVVDPVKAEVTPTDKSEWYGATETPEDRSPPRVPPTGSTASWVHIDTSPDSTYRYREERIYDGDPLLVLGVFTNTVEVPQPAAVDEVAEGGEDAFEGEVPPVDANDAGVDGPDDEPPSVAEELYETGARITRNRIAHGSRREPLILSTTPQQQHIELMAKGGLAAFFVALFPLALAILLLWARYG
ncbi:MAG: hypothetical protein HUU46_00605 [Candidatus Hydrogenedentes bacterium]|nr:hypothetical protein [Candidatus Hydrogenedentota bacterium]